VVVSDVNLDIVREFFELNQFAVMTKWEHEQGGADPALQLYVERTAPLLPDGEAGFVLAPPELAYISRAAVEIRAWHSDRVYPSAIEPSGAFRHLVEEDSLNQAADHFGTDDFAKILVISELPISAEPRDRAIQLLEQIGITHILEFPAILKDMLDKVNPSTNYAASLTLQLLRLLKAYRFIRHQQLEFTFPTDPQVVAGQAFVDTVEDDTIGDEIADLDEEGE
jgi:hypothetical protein